MMLQIEPERMRRFFESGVTRPYEFRLAQLNKLKSLVIEFEDHIYRALHTDLGKSPEECWVTENGFLLSEINNAIKKLRAWMKPEKVRTNLMNFPSSSYNITEPLGVVLIIGPWNYPLQLLFTPMVGAIAAGNCVVLKASEYAPATAAVMKQIISKGFDNEYITITDEDGSECIPRLMKSFVFDHVFYTGSTEVGKKIYEMAARDLVPVTLELGGKSPCIIAKDADLTVTAKRIALTKFSNSGQMCVAPDYLLVHTSVRNEFISLLKSSLVQLYGKNVFENPEYGKIINQKQFDRLVKLIPGDSVLHGGRNDPQNLKIEPTLVEVADISTPLMQDEIFGPVLPIISYDKNEDAINIISKNKNPLALYIFSESSEIQQFFTENIAFGGGCINNASFHLTNHRLPFGGRGNSGIGSYHGHFSYMAFSHRKGMMRTPTWFDPSSKYPPYRGKLKLLKWLIR